LFGERLEDRVMLAVVFSHDLDDPVRAVVPTQADYDEFGLEWTGSSEPFDDVAWAATGGTSNAVGYDRGSGAYDSLLGLDIESTMYNRCKRPVRRVLQGGLTWMNRMLAISFGGTWSWVGGARRGSGIGGGI